MNAELVNRIRQCPTLPSLPTIAMEVLELTRKVDVDIAEIAAIITKDPALSGKILRTVNSSFYGRSQHVSTISQAMVILGLQSVKTLVLGFSLTTTLHKNKTKGFDILGYWKRSIYSATAARTIGKKMNLVQIEEAFLAALLKDIGMLVLDQVLEGKYGETCAEAHSHQELLLVENRALGMTHADAGAILAEVWKLPPILAVPIASSHAPEEVKDPSLRKLCELIELAGLCADVYVDDEPGPAIKTVHELLAARFKASEADSNVLLEEIGRRTKEVATLFEIQIGKTDSFESILKRANETLVEISLQTQRQATQLQEQNRTLAHQATTDGLTGLFCRSHFDKVLAEQVAAHIASSSIISSRSTTASGIPRAIRFFAPWPG
jgi:HD-like signal output (HDOD) protein